MREIVETDDPEDSSLLGSDELTPDNVADLVLSADMFNSSTEDLQPDPIHIFRLWQLYLDRVNPLFKVIHVPTTQPFVMEAATNMSNLPLHYQALMFSIFAMASVSMTSAECIQTIGISREAAIQRFNTGTKSALIKYSFLKNHNMTALQAVVLYLVSSMPDIHFHLSPSNNGLLLTHRYSFRLKDAMTDMHNGSSAELSCE